MKPMRAIFAGTPEAAVPTLEHMHASGIEVALVLTQPDARGRRGSSLVPSPVKTKAMDLGLPVFQPTRASSEDAVAAIAAVEADVAAVVAYGQILSVEALAAVRTHWINMHFSLLPRWRGAAPVQQGILAGDDQSGITTFVIEEGLDTGPIIESHAYAIGERDTAGDVLSTLAHRGAPMMVSSLRSVHHGSAVLTPQDSTGVTYAPKLTREDAYIQWDAPAHTVDRQVRACTPAPGAWTTLPDGTTAKIGPVLPEDASASAPGTIHSAGKQIFVSCGTGQVQLTTIAPAGKKPMPADAWWRGARVHEGAQLGET